MKAFAIFCVILLIISPVVVSFSLNPFSSKTTQPPYYYGNAGYDSHHHNDHHNNGYNNGNGYGNGMYYNPPTTTRASYIKNALKGAGLGALASGAYTYFKNGKK